MNTFSATECIKFGWETFKKRPWYLIGVVILSYIPTAILNSIDSHMHGGVYVVFYILSLLVSTAIGFLVTSFLLRAHDDVEHVELKDAWSRLEGGLFLNYMAAFILQMLVIGIGLILLIVPGVIFMLMFSQTQYLVIDRRMGPIEAMKESARIMKGKKGELFLLGILAFAVMLLGIICLLVGILVAIPVLMLAQVHAYRMIAGRADAVVTATTTVPTTEANPTNPSVIS